MEGFPWVIHDKKTQEIKPRSSRSFEACKRIPSSDERFTPFLICLQRKKVRDGWLPGDLHSYLTTHSFRRHRKEEHHGNRGVLRVQLQGPHRPWRLRRRLQRPSENGKQTARLQTYRVGNSKLEWVTKQAQESPQWRHCYCDQSKCFRIILVT